MELRFRTHWQAEEIARPLTSQIDHAFSTVDTTSNARQLAVQFERLDRNVSWIGAFEGATRLPEAVHGVFSYPDPEVALIVAAGQGYLVNTLDPREWVAIEESPLVAIAD